MTTVDGMPGRQLGEATYASPNVRQGRMQLRALLLKGVGSAIVIIAAGYAVYGWYAGSATVSTDDAYVGAVFAQVTAEIDGTIRSVQVHDTQFVRRGDVLVTLDSKDAELDRDAARAAYAGAYREFQQKIAATDAAQTIVMAKRSLLAQAQQQLRRRAGIERPGVIAAEEVSNSRSALEAAKYAVLVAEHEWSAKRAAAGRDDIESDPEILGAKVVLRRSELRLQRTYIRAPVDGLVAQSRIQIGQKIAAGSELMTIVPTRQLFVDANFKESQIKGIRAGQLVTLKSDVYGSGRAFHGFVQGVGGGTGATFAVIPPQNATGNWIKVVQRLPVRIALDPDELMKTPLRAGSSMTAEVHLDRYVDAPSPDKNKSRPERGGIALRSETSGLY